MKSPLVAFLLSFFIPGLGLAYVGRKGAGLANFLLALVAPAAVLWIWPATALDFLHYVMLAIAAGSGGLAHAAALALRRSRRPA